MFLCALNPLDTSDDSRATLDALSEIALTINTIQDPDTLLEQVLEIAMETLEAERGFILLTSKTQPKGFEVKSSRNVAA